MAHDMPDEKSMYDFLFDDSPEQIIAGTPLSPQFNPDVLDPACHTSAHATASGDRPIVPRPAPPQQLPRINPAGRYPTAPENANPLEGQPRNFARPLPFQHRPQAQPQSPLISTFPTTASSCGQTSFTPPSIVEWQTTGRPSLDYNTPSDLIPPTDIVNNSSDIDHFGYNLNWPGSGTGSTHSNIAPQSLMTADPNPWRDDDDFDDDVSPAILKTDVEGDDPSYLRHSSTSKRQKKGPKGAGSELSVASPTATTYSQDNGASIGSKPSTLTSTASGSATSSRPSKLRSASRTSKNTQHKPAETAEERRTRASHNFVEKQYRNRLNNQFEALLNALPEQVRGGGEGEDSEPAIDFTDKRVSKAEVLDMARRYIKALERERDALERERNELYSNVEKLREMYGLPKDDGGGGFGSGEDYDVAGGPSAPAL